MYDTDSNKRFILTNNKILLSITQMIGHKLSLKDQWVQLQTRIFITLGTRASTSHSDPDKLTYKN